MSRLYRQALFNATNEVIKILRVFACRSKVRNIDHLPSAVPFRQV